MEVSSGSNLMTQEFHATVPVSWWHSDERRRHADCHPSGAVSQVSCERPEDRPRVGCEAGLTGAILDAQAARSGGVGVEGVRGYDPAKRVVGHKRDALTDTDGRLMMAAVSSADLHDSHGGRRAPARLASVLAVPCPCFADCAYRGERVGTAPAITVEIVEP
ncbi:MULTISPECIES: transposase [Methylobacterium]|uniref:Transposase of ISMdi17, IS5 family n=1 Tax=Methylobacterium aquaticum TaxID=270351 RepID=A0A0C6FLP4_9HYPH|nr:transposase of ISMdi17, IS5 family [Methylobacterium aquaticum]